MASTDPGFVTARRALIICTTPRTGSKLLCDGVWRTKLAGKPDEYFAPEARRELGRFGTAKSKRAYVREVARRATTPNGIMSIKVHWDHMDLVRDCLAAPAGSRNRFAQLAPVVDFCWLRRRDTVRQAVSLFRARASNQWHSAQPRQSPPDRLEFDYPAIKELVAAITQWNSSWERYFGDLAISPMALYYEDDLERDYRPAVTRILRMLEVEVPGTLTLRAGPERQSDEQSEELVRRYHEAAAAKQP